MYVVKFIRKDNQPEENYFYNDLKDAMDHLNLFFGDDSGLYKKIELVEARTNKTISYIQFWYTVRES